MLTSKLLIVIVRRVRPVVSQKEIHKPLVSAERNRPGGQELVEVKERLIKSRWSQAESLEPPDGQGWLLGVSPLGASQGKAGISWGEQELVQGSQR